MRRTQFQVNYTFSSVKDDASDVFDLAGSYSLPQNSLSFAGEYAPANFDARHRVAYNYIVDLPAGIQVAGTGQFQTGQPFTVTVAARNNAGTGGTNSEINASILYSVGTADLVISNVGAPWADTLYNSKPSTTYEVVGAQDNAWRACELHQLFFTVTPLRSGTLYTRLRVTLHDGDAGPNYVNDTSGSGGTIVTDQQGFAVRQYATEVTNAGPWTTLAYAPPQADSVVRTHGWLVDPGGRLGREDWALNDPSGATGLAPVFVGLPNSRTATSGVVGQFGFSQQ